MIGAEQAGGSNAGAWLSVAALAVSAGVGLATAWVSRRNARDQQEGTVAANGLEGFGVIGSLGVQIAEQIIDQTEAVRSDERHDCDEKIAAVRAELGATALQCHEELDLLRKEIEALRSAP